MPLPVFRSDTCLAACVAACLGFMPGFVAAQAAPRGSLPNPILFVTQVPVPADFATIGSVFANHQDLDLEALRARLLSNSYLPGTGHPRSSAMLEAAERLFREHQREGVVRLDYDCVLVLGKM